MNEIMVWAGFIRDIGLIVGIPVLIGVGVKLYSQQIEILKARNDLLKETQYDRAVSLLESQKKAFLMEREALDKRITDLEREKSESDTQLAEMKREIADVVSEIKSMMPSSKAPNKENSESALSEQRREFPKSGR